MKTKYVIAILTIVILVATNVSAEPIDTLDYEETKMIAIPGDVNLTFYSSPTGTEDISLLFRLHDQNSNVTIYNVKSNTIIYDSTFINDTKIYIFHDDMENPYEIGVNYTAIQVPPTVEEIIAGYEAIIDELNVNNSIALGKLNVVREALNQSLSDFEALTIELNEEKAKTAPLLGNIGNLTQDLEEFQFQYSKLENEKRHFENKMNEYQNGWAMFMSDGFHFNMASASLTAIVIFALFGYLWSRKNDKPFPGLSQVNKLIGKEEVMVHEDDPE